MSKKTKEQISYNMQQIKSKGSLIETTLELELWHRGMHYRKNAKAILGHPDIVFVARKIVIFCDGEFWHGKDWDRRKDEIKSNRDYWIPKIERNMERDKEVTKGLEEQGWIVLRYWGRDILKNTTAIADEVEAVYRSRDYLVPDKPKK